MGHSITSVKVLARRLGTPGLFKVSVQGTDGEGLPNGVEIATGSVSANAWTTDVAGAWYSVTLDVPVALSNGTMYALVFSTPDEPGGSPDQVMLKSDRVVSDYAGGTYCSLGMGVWSKETTWDFLFEEWDAVAKYQYYDTGGTTWEGLWGTREYAQTFTVAGSTFAPPTVSGITYTDPGNSPDYTGTPTGENMMYLPKKLVAISGNNKVWFESV